MPKAYYRFCLTEEYWSGLPFPSPGDLPNPRIEPGSPELQADSLSSEPPGKPESFFKAKGDRSVTYRHSPELREVSFLWQLSTSGEQELVD